MNTCSTCKWFEQRERQTVVGVLAALMGASPQTIVIGFCNQDDAKWYVKDPPPDFGCIHHEPEQPDK